ncbi:diacylglycerol/lipid kinase family protein [Flavobacterium sp. '19STA2R22 D10 B1']|uniref:diacylglycerol/lipid kinase family protein n=1 Tax=Flavobacterium aerium TaxID=3037261 RepID=UPI00278C5300|nr:diacylglycerol kinase family protein [Flavobacterium sp. '19STA2R22 D10 B1']
MIYLHFIVNPISGKGKHNITKGLLEAYFPTEKYKIDIDYSKYKKHAITLTKAAIEKQPDVIVACGGDGTINEVASCLINTEIQLGIIPIGSGNGLASNLKIPQNIDKAILIIKNGQAKAIDVGRVNEHYFFSNMGLGIDAMIIHNYEKHQKRTLSAYVKASMKASTAYKAPKAIVQMNNKTLEVAPFMLFISNSNEMGYKMSLTPSASLRDGLLDLLIVEKLNFLNKMYLGGLVLFNKTEKLKKSHRDLIQKATIIFPENETTDIQIDGEYYNLSTNIINVSVLPHSLKILLNEEVV